MNGLVLLIAALMLFILAYFGYGRWLARLWGVDEKAPTPAYSLQDGVDYVPARRSVVFGHQFASIAGAGPINGPIIAAMFGWVPVALWIIFGGIFFGAVQDFSAMYASVKSKGKTIGYIIELYIGRTGKQLFLVFVWLFSILVVAAFADIVAVTFNGFTPERALIAANASVATTSILFIAAAVGLGFFLQKRQPSGYRSGVVAVILLIVCVTLGLACPIYVARNYWLYFVFAYVFIASVTPVWALLQPRDYLNSFLLVFMIAAAVVGVVFTNPTMELPAFTGFEVNGNYLFPILFVTVACGAISGFHSLVSSGTSSKQIENERDMLPISFGGMLVECLLAIIALIAAGSVAIGGKLPAGSPPVIFAQAVSSFLTNLGFPTEIVYTLVTLSISAFALTSLDSVARVGRLAFQEFFSDSSGLAKPDALSAFFANRYVATFWTLLFGYLLALVGYQNIWPLFGSANQLLGALSLLACAVFLKKTNRQGWMLHAPMFIMLAITFSALAVGAYKLLAKIPAGNFGVGSDGLQLVFAVLLFALGVMVARSGLSKLKNA
ncbi:MAG: carbon starvation protein A [Planctomycetota bacterium]|jgi:carbon starvation protein|nr:carbon starvation protein A [Planctomycetota bacterium]